MRRVTQSEFVRRRAEKAAQDYPSFQMAWDQGVIWLLQRSSLQDAVPMPRTDPQEFVLEITSWRQAGLPVMRIAYVERPDELEIIRLALITG